MNDKPQNPPVFLQLAVEACERDGHGDTIDPFTSVQGGMTLRDFFAAQAVAGLIALKIGVDDAAPN